MGIIYSIGIGFYTLMIRVASLFSKKAKDFVEGRSNWETSLQSWKDQTKKPVLWLHCASLGEYEMARPLIPYFKERGHDILLSFYSPSGYNHYKDNPDVDQVSYLPMDTKRNARRWLSILEPEAVVFVKYDFWFRLIAETAQRNIPLFLINGIFRSDHVYFKPYGDWFLRRIAAFNHLFLINESSAHLLDKKGFNNISVTGDLRYDRVSEICNTAPSNAILEAFKNDEKLVIGGSSWQPEEKILLAVSNFFPEQKILIAPHDISKDHIKEIRKLFKGRKITTYSRAKNKDLSQYQVLIIDNVGMLSSAYQYADIALIGGAFGKGLHNFLEAATFGIPLYFGPNIKHFPEALEMVKKGLAESISHEDEFIRGVDRVRLGKAHDKAGQLAAFMKSKQGAAEAIRTQMEESGMWLR